MVDGREIRVGGYGFPISDEGSGADLGLHAIRLALRASDGRALATNFTREVMSRFGNDAFEAVAWMDRATATDYATFAPLVMRYAERRRPDRRAHRARGGRTDRRAGAPADRAWRAAGSRCSAAWLHRSEPWLAPDVQRRLSPVQSDALAGALPSRAPCGDAERKCSEAGRPGCR